jgi:hypothetical protein
MGILAGSAGVLFFMFLVFWREKGTMRRLIALAVVLGAAILGFVLVVAWYLSSLGSGSSLGGIMGQMMGNSRSDGMTTAMPTGVWILLVALVVLAVLGALGVGYYMAFPEIVPEPNLSSERPAQPQPGSTGVSWEVLVRTAKPEERKVLEVLSSHNGRYLQKFIVKDSGLSRLKTHRIISRFVERGIVVAEKSGNTNEISLAPWLHPEPPAS